MQNYNKKNYSNNNNYNNNNNYGNKPYGGKKSYNNNNVDNYYGNPNNKSKNNNNNSYQPSQNKVMKTTEEGFTGTPDQWFSDEEFHSRLLTKSHKDQDYYFNSYSSFYIHEEMIKDTVRTNAYRDAIMNNPEAFKDKVVLDIGAGTGILSIFAARAGAKHVYALEFAHIADYTTEIIKKNGLSDKITVIKAKVEECTLPVDTVDIIISEWMGYFCLYESMMDTVLYARDKWLVKDGSGIILPDTVHMYVGALEDADYKQRKLDFWHGVGYDIDMTCIKPSVLCEPLIDVCDKKYIISNNCKIQEIDLYTVKVEDLDFTAQYELTFNRNDTFSGLIGWFDTIFKKLPKPITLSTSPYTKATHWKQTTFYHEKDISVSEGDTLKGSIAVRKAQKNHRELDVKISYKLKGYYSESSSYQLYKIR